MFGDRRRERVCADYGADGNIMDEATPQNRESVGSKVDVHTLGLPRVFEMFATILEGTRARHLSSKQTVAVLGLHLRQVTALKVRDVK